MASLPRVATLECDTYNIRDRGFFWMKERIPHYPHMMSSRLYADRRLVCRSDADSQLLLYIPFNQTVKLTGVVFDSPAEEHPTVAKIFVNSTPMGFEEAEEADPAQVCVSKAGRLQLQWPCKL